jgi:hypothetical protein
MKTSPIPFAQKPHVSASVHNDGVVFFDAEQGQLFASNRTGAYVWQRLEQGWSAERIAEDLSARYHLPVSTARIHAARFIAQLEDRQLIERRAA